MENALRPTRDVVESAKVPRLVIRRTMGRQVRKKTETYEMSLVYGVVTLVALLP